MCQLDKNGSCPKYNIVSTSQGFRRMDGSGTSYSSRNSYSSSRSMYRLSYGRMY